MTEPRAWILSDAYAGLQAQAMGLTEAAGLRHELRTLAPRAPWRWIAARLWPAPLSAVPDAVPLTQELKAELDRRLDAYHRNPGAGSPWAEVLERLRKQSR